MFDKLQQHSRLFLVGALCLAFAATFARAADAPGWLLRCGDLQVSGRMFLLGLSVRGGEKKSEDARAKADRLLRMQRERLCLAAKAESLGLGQDAKVQTALREFRRQHLEDLFREERIIKPAYIAARDKGAGNKQAEAAIAKEERNRLYRKESEVAAKEFPAEILATSLPAAGAADPDPVVARVAGREVRAAEVRAGIARVAHPGGREGTDGRVFATVLDSIVTGIRFGALAERQGFAERPEFVDDLGDRRVRLLADRYAETEIYPAVQVTDKDVDAFYASNQEQLRRGEEKEIYEILLVDGETAKAVAARLAAGMDFAAAVQEYSQGTTKAKGGFLGYYMNGEAHPDLERAIRTLQPGQVSKVVSTPYGFHILRCNQVVQGRVPPVDGIREKIRAALLEQRRAEALSMAARGLEAEFPVELNQDGYQEILKKL